MCKNNISCIMILLMLATLSISCKHTGAFSDQKNNERIVKASPNQLSSQFKSGSDEKLQNNLALYPLAYEKYQQLLNSENQISEIWISYSMLVDNDPSGNSPPTSSKNLDMIVGKIRKAINFSSISEYKANYSYVNYSTGQNIADERTFAPSNLEAIYDYLDEKHQYFFNHDEFGNQPVIITDTIWLNPKKYSFTLAFFDPSDTSLEHDKAWVISKSSDNPSSQDDPDHILQGLIDILETNFISQFEQ
jgi:hypothetical protein